MKPQKYTRLPLSKKAAAKARAMGRKRNLVANLSSGRRWMNSPPKVKRETLRCTRKKIAYRHPQKSAALSLLRSVRASA